MKNFSAIVLFCSFLLTLSACGGGSPEDPMESASKNFSYRNESLECVQTGWGKNQTINCDFEYFYSKNPKLLSDYSESKEKNVSWVKLEGKPLACVTTGGGDAVARSCDFKRYYGTNPGALDR